MDWIGLDGLDWIGLDWIDGIGLIGEFIGFDCFVVVGMLGLVWLGLSCS